MRDYTSYERTPTKHLTRRELMAEEGFPGWPFCGPGVPRAQWCLYNLLVLLVASFFHSNFFGNDFFRFSIIGIASRRILLITLTMEILESILILYNSL